jgi:glycosyltransferase involved in cell wall biosynthesis
MGRPFHAPPPHDSVTTGPVPTFSLVVAAYQVADMIGDTLESAFAQTHPALEVIVCDDGSTDDLERAVTPWRDRITFIRKENGGVASAYNTLARAASGDFFTIIDPDDTYEPERLEALAELAVARPDLDILTTDAWVEVAGERVERYYTGENRFETDDQRRRMLETNFVFGLAALRRERVLALGGFDESIVSTSDWDVFIRLVLDGARAGMVDEPLATYRLREGSLTSSRPRYLRGRSATLRKTLARPDLSEAERGILRRQLDDHTATLLRLDAQEALMARGPHARSLSARVLTGRWQPLQSRAKAALALVAPPLARVQLERSRAKAAADARKIRSARE